MRDQHGLQWAAIEVVKDAAETAPGLSDGIMPPVQVTSLYELDPGPLPEVLLSPSAASVIVGEHEVMYMRANATLRMTSLRNMMQEDVPKYSKHDYKTAGGICCKFNKFWFPGE